MSTYTDNNVNYLYTVGSGVASVTTSSSATDTITILDKFTVDSTEYNVTSIDYQAFLAGNWGAEKVQYYTPYLTGDKFSILEDGEKCCETLGLDFDEVYRRTNTSYKPMIHLVFDNYGNPSPEWFSDYKSASSVERVEAFMKLGRKDPVSYADEFGIVTWEFVKEYVSSVLDDHAKTV